MTILLIDTDDDFRLHLTKQLAKRGLTVRESRNPAEGRRLAQEEPVDVALVGLSKTREPLLPFLSEIRHDCPDSKVILINHSGDVSLSIEAMKLGAADEVSAPVDLEELLRKIASATSGKKCGK